MKPRKTLGELAAGAEKPVTLNGKPADVCPYCGCALFANGTNTLPTVIFRYVICRNRNCGRKFLSKQPPATLVREVGSDDEDSSSGEVVLSLRKGIA